MSVAAESATPRKGTPWRALIALFLVSLIWGATFVWMKQALAAAASRLGPGHDLAAAALFLALRFAAAALVVLVISRSARGTLRRSGSRPAWQAGVWLGCLLLIGFGLQMRGLAGVSPAVSAFLTSLYVVFTALMSALRSRRGLRVSLAFGALLATVGAGLVRGRPELGFTGAEWLTVASAFVFSVHILATDRLTRVVEPMSLTFTSFAVIAAGNAVLFAVCFASGAPLEWRDVTSLLQAREFLVPLGLTTILATVVALSLMNVFQREIDPVRAAILYAFEPIFALFFGLLAGLDVLTPWLWVGGGVILLGNLVAEIGNLRGGRSRAPSTESAAQAAGP